MCTQLTSPICDVTQPTRSLIQRGTVPCHSFSSSSQHGTLGIQIIPLGRDVGTSPLQILSLHVQSLNLGSECIPLSLQHLSLLCERIPLSLLKLSLGGECIPLKPQRLPLESERGLMKLFKLLRRLSSLIHAAQATCRPPWRRYGHRAYHAGYGDRGCSPHDVCRLPG